MKKLCIIILILATGCQLFEKHKTIKVVGVKDGDTIVLLYEDNHNETIRLADIDCPEKSQPFGKAAKKLTSDLCFGKGVTLKTAGKSGGWGRIVGTIYVDDSICVNKELVKAGLAWHYKQYSTDQSYAELEEQARAQRKGLWADADPIPPWEWRHHKKAKHKKAEEAYETAEE